MSTSLRKRLLAAAGILSISCSDRGPTTVDAKAVVGSIAVSEAISGATARDGSSLPSSVVYVALPAGTLSPDAAYARIRLYMGNAITVPVTDGAIEPIALSARPGDVVWIEVFSTEGLLMQGLQEYIPVSHRPELIRTIPARARKAVPLNARIVVVFNEPIRSGSTSSLRLLHNGTAVSAQVELSSDGLRAEIKPSELLLPNADYVISVAGVVDLSGETFDGVETTTFSTGSDVAVATALTESSALFVNPYNSKLRTFDMNAWMTADGKANGTFTIYYEELGFRSGGRITCMSKASDGKIFLGGVYEYSPQHLFDIDVGWVLYDGGKNGPDSLSLASPLDYDGMSAADWCSGRINTTSEGPLDLFTPSTGDIVANGLTSDMPVAAEPPPFHLEFLPQPITTFDSMALGSLAVRIARSDNSTVAGYRGVVALTLTSSGSSVLVGKTTARADKGFASFNDLQVIGPGTALRLHASAVLNQDATSNSFDVMPRTTPSGRIALSLNECEGSSPTDFDDTKCSSNIWIVNADGTEQKSVTPIQPVGSYHIHPAWSRDGNRIAFVAAKDGEFEGYCCGHGALYLVNDDGTNLHALTAPIGVGHPAWSPDGSKIAFNLDDQIWIVNADGSGIRQLTTGRDMQPAWSPDGNAIAFSRLGEGWEIYRVNVDGTGVKRISGNAGSAKQQPVWMPDGSHVAYRAYVDKSDGSLSSIRIAAADGSTDVALPGASSLQYVAGLAVSPDGASFLISRGLEDSPGGGFTGFSVDVLGPSGVIYRQVLKTIMPKSTNDRPAWGVAKP